MKRRYLFATLQGVTSDRPVIITVTVVKIHKIQHLAPQPGQNKVCEIILRYYKTKQRETILWKQRDRISTLTKVCLECSVFILCESREKIL